MYECTNIFLTLYQIKKYISIRTEFKSNVCFLFKCLNVERGQDTWELPLYLLQTDTRSFSQVSQA